MKLFFENKKLRGLGYSVLRKQNMGRFIAFYLLSPWQNLKVYFYNGICQCDSIQKESLLSPNCGEVRRKICFVIPQRSTRFYMWEDETNISPKNRLTIHSH